MKKCENFQGMGQLDSFRRFYVRPWVAFVAKSPENRQFLGPTFWKFTTHCLLRKFLANFLCTLLFLFTTKQFNRTCVDYSSYFISKITISLINTWRRTVLIIFLFLERTNTNKVCQDHRKSTKVKRYFTQNVIFKYDSKSHKWIKLRKLLAVNNDVYNFLKTHNEQQ